MARYVMRACEIAEFRPTYEASFSPEIHCNGTPPFTKMFPTQVRVANFTPYYLQSHSIHGMTDEDKASRPHREMGNLTYEEKKFLLAVERGDVASVRR